ncbi:IgGFc-binding protein-like [Crassostrea virginica]
MTIGSRGKSFIVLFMTDDGTSTKNIYITSENGVQMNMPTSEHLGTSLKSQIDRVVKIPSNEHIIVPPEITLSSFQKETKAILLETSDDVFVFTHADGRNTVGSTTQIPIHKLSTKYVVISTEPMNSQKSQIAVAAIEDNTTIAVTLKMRQNIGLTINRNIYRNNDVFNVTLNSLETYQIAHTTDLTGSVIESSKPIAAFSGNDCNKLENIGACDHLIEQLPPIDGVDTTYIVPPNSDNRDTKVLITAVKNTNLTYTIDSTPRTLFLNEYTSIGTIISSNQIFVVQSENPVLVTAFGLHSKSSELGDPSMTIVPGINQYLDYYKIVVPRGYDHNYISIMIKHAAKDSFRINGSIMNMYHVKFEGNVIVGNIKYNVRTIQVTDGELTASTVDGERFGLMFTGVTYYEAYGFSGNSMLL